MKIAILGFGREGQSILKFFQKREGTRKDKSARTNAKEDEIWIVDKKPTIKVPRGVRVQTGKNYLNLPAGGLKRFDIIFRSPGVRYLSPEIQRAKKAGVEISSATKLFFEQLRRPTQTARGLTQKKAGASQWPMIIGITGTKGKGTTSTILYQILRDAGKNVFLAGNIGLPVLEILPRLSASSPRKSAPIVILELSSFQLIDLDTSPHIAVVLMVTSEHLDWHASTNEYIAAKTNLVRFQSPRDFAVLARDYPKSASFAKKTRASIYSFSRKSRVQKGTYAKDGFFWFSDGKKKEKVCSVGKLAIPGEHNWENTAAAITVAKILKISNAVIARTLHNFKGLEHRLEFVAERNGVKYYDDSYSTTPETAQVATEAFNVPKILILGGSSKGSNFRSLGRAISKSKSTKAIIGIGVEWPRIKAHIRNPKIKIIEGCKNMKGIVRAARKIASPGDVVILSPACASFDMFKNYAARGEEFKKIVKGLKSR